MTTVDYLGYSFGSVVYLSGLAGFLVQKNKISLALGTVFGGVACLGAHQATEQPHEPLIALANAGAFSSVQIFRNIKQFKRPLVINIALKNNENKYFNLLLFFASFNVMVDDGRGQISNVKK